MQIMQVVKRVTQHEKIITVTYFMCEGKVNKFSECIVTE